MSDPVVIDTHSFNRMLSDGQKYRLVYRKLQERCDRLLITEQIVDEYIRMAPKAGVVPTTIQGEHLPALRRLGKLQRTGNRPVRVGPRQDRPFIGAALEGRARYIVSNDRGFRTRPVRRELQGARVDVLFPEQYTALQ